jgi:hypothetical protein
VHARVAEQLGAEAHSAAFGYDTLVLTCTQNGLSAPHFSAASQVALHCVVSHP